MSTLSNVDYASYSDDELEQAIKDIQKVKINRKASNSNKTKIFIKSLSNQENESLSKDQNMLKTYIIRHSSPYVNHGGVVVGHAYSTQNNRKDIHSLGYDFSTCNNLYNCSKENIGGRGTGKWAASSIESFVSFSYNEI